MRKLAIIGLLFVTSILGACGERVDPGFVGIKVDLYGTDKGVQQEVLTPGWYYLGFTSRMYEFPTFEQNVIYTKDVRKESPTDEALYLQAGRDGMRVDVDVGLQYQIDPTKVSLLFQKYRLGIEEITRTVIRNAIRDSAQRNSNTMTVEEIYGSRKNELIDRIEQDVRDQFAPYGILIKNIAFISEVRVPESIRRNIEAKIGAIQLTQQRENEVAQSRAEAQKKIEEARGIAESLRIQAEAEAQSLNIKGEALRRNPEMLQLEAVLKWNGVLPQMMTSGSPVPFVTIPQNK